MHPPCLAARVLIGSFLPAVLTFTGAARPGGDQGSDNPPVRHYLEEESGRILRIDESDPAKVKVQVRFPGEPGFFFLWHGEGVKDGTELAFSRLLAEEEVPGAKFLAKGGGRLEVLFAPEQIEPADEGILGEYRRLSEEKRLSLATRALKAADSALERSRKSWGGKREPGLSEALEEWKLRWPVLRQRWVGRNTLPSDTKTTTPLPPADEVYRVIEATGQAIALFQHPRPEGDAPPDGSGNYHDGFGGGLTLRSRSDGSFRINFGWQRGDLEVMGSEFGVDIPAAEIKRARGGDDWHADFNLPDPDLPEVGPRARLRLAKKGRFLFVELLDGTRHTGPGWVDGIYLWGPIPVEG